MKTFNKALLLAAVLASAANANVQVNGDTTIGLKYTLKDNDSTQEDKFSVESGNDNQGFTHLRFTAAEGGKGGQGGKGGKGSKGGKGGKGSKCGGAGQGGKGGKCGKGDDGGKVVRVVNVIKVAKVVRVVNLAKVV